jgi:hypothetical protein
MSAWEDVPGKDEWTEYTDAEWDEYMRDVYRGLRAYWFEREHHDRRGYFAELAGSPDCLALGHKPDPETDWVDVNDHQRGWDGDYICEATRYGEACMECEGNCDFEFFDATALWKAVAA